MKTSSIIHCTDFPCLDTRRASYLVPDVDIDPDKVSILLISEAAPENPADGYYAGPEALFAQTTVLAFQDAGAKVASIQDILAMGVYLTTAIKCGKTGYGIATRDHPALFALTRKRNRPLPERRSLPADGRRGHQSH